MDSLLPLLIERFDLVYVFSVSNQRGDQSFPSAVLGILHVFDVVNALEFRAQRI